LHIFIDHVALQNRVRLGVQSRKNIVSLIFLLPLMCTS